MTEIGVIIMKKILVLGASGFIGKAICEELSKEHEVYGTYYSNKIKPEGTMMLKLDIGNEDQLNNILQTVEPDVVVSSLRGDYVYQLEAHRNLAGYLDQHGIRLFYLSSANVYDAVTDKAHVESDPVGSSSDYGKFKIKCERLLHETMGPLVTILRLPMVFGKESKRILDIKEGLKRGGPLVVYSDFYLNVHANTLLAKQLAYLIDEDAEGIIHLGSHDVVAYKTAMSLLIKELGYEGIPLQFERIQEQPYYMAVITEKSILPVDLMFSVEQIVDALK